MSGTRAISTTSRRKLSSSFFFFLKDKAPKEFHAILTETLTCFFPGGVRTSQRPCIHVTPNVPNSILLKKYCKPNLLFRCRVAVVQRYVVLVLLTFRVSIFRCVTLRHPATPIITMRCTFILSSNLIWYPAVLFALVAVVNNEKVLMNWDRFLTTLPAVKYARVTWRGGGGEVGLEGRLMSWIINTAISERMYRSCKKHLAN